VGRCCLREWRSRDFPFGVRLFVTQDRLVLLRATRSGIVFRGRCLPFVSADGEDQLRFVWAVIWGDIMKRKDLSKNKTSLVHADGGALLKPFPNLREFLTAAVFEGSKDRRESPTLTVWASGGTWRCSVKDRAEGLVLWITAPELGEVLEMLEGFVLSPDAPWRHDDQSHERNGKRVKKGS